MTDFSGRRNSICRRIEERHITFQEEQVFDVTRVKDSFKGNRTEGEEVVERGKGPYIKCLVILLKNLNFIWM